MPCCLIGSDRLSVWMMARVRALMLLSVCALAIAAGCTQTSKAAFWKTEVSDDGTRVALDGRELLSYRHMQVPFKPYVERLRTPSGINILRDAPHDHLHHHGLMYAVAVDGVTFWAETAESGRELSKSTSGTAPHTAGPWQCARLRDRLDWVEPQGRHLLSERRLVEIYAGDDLDASLLTWQTRLSAPEHRQQARLHGSAYYGLGMRYIESMDDNGRFFNADGATGVAATNDVKSDWCAYAAMADGHPVTVAIFNHPDNPRSPARWFTMDDPFAYLSATPGLHHEEMTLEKGSPLLFRYGVALWDGHVEAGTVAALYDKWKALPVEQWGMREGIPAGVAARRDSRTSEKRRNSLPATGYENARPVA